jgi:hypothetical protein
MLAQLRNCCLGGCRSDKIRGETNNLLVVISNLSVFPHLLSNRILYKLVKLHFTPIGIGIVRLSIHHSMVPGTLTIDFQFVYIIHFSLFTIIHIVCIHIHICIHCITSKYVDQ